MTDMTAPTAAPTAAPEAWPRELWLGSAFNGQFPGRWYYGPVYASAATRLYVPESALAAERERCRRLRELLARALPLLERHYSHAPLLGDIAAEVPCDGGGNDANAG